MFGQCGVLVLMGIYLMGVDDDEGLGMDSLGGIVVAAIVVACIWSGGVSAVVAGRAVRAIFSCCSSWPRSTPEIVISNAHRDGRNMTSSKLSTLDPAPAPSASCHIDLAKVNLTPQISRAKTM